MWRVNWYGSYSEFSRTFDTEEKARRFLDSLVTKHKKIYKAF